MVEHTFDAPDTFGNHADSIPLTLRSDRAGKMRQAISHRKR